MRHLKSFCRIAALAFTFAASSTVASSTAFAAPHDVVLAVGSDLPFSTVLKPLRYAASDAARFAETMRDLGAVTRANILQLTNPTRADLAAAIATVATRAATPGAKFVFYFSGHSDADGLYLRDGLWRRDELHALLQSVAMRTKIVILDGCFSAALARKGAAPAKAFELPTVMFDQPTGSVFLTASGQDDAAYESATIESGLFTHRLLLGLHGQADLDEDGIVTVDEVYAYAYQQSRIEALGNRDKPAPRPSLVTSLEGRGRVPLTFLSRGAATLELGADVDGRVTIASSKGLRYLTFDKRAGETKRVSLPATTYELAIDAGGSVGRTVVALERGTLSCLSRSGLEWTAPTSLRRTARGGDATSRFDFMAGARAGYDRGESQAKTLGLVYAHGALFAGLGTQRATLQNTLRSTGLAVGLSFSP